MEFSKETTFMGRNGRGRCKGIQIWDSNNTISLLPITSKGVAANCDINIPAEDIHEFCSHLQADLVSLVLQNIPPDYLPALLGLNDQLDALVAKELGNDKQIPSKSR